MSLCDRALERESNVLCACLYLCVCAGKGEGGIRGEVRDEENERAA